VSIEYALISDYTKYFVTSFGRIDFQWACAKCTELSSDPRYCTRIAIHVIYFIHFILLFMRGWRTRVTHFVITAYVWWKKSF